MKTKEFEFRSLQADLQWMCDIWGIGNQKVVLGCFYPPLMYAHNSSVAGVPFKRAILNSIGKILNKLGA